MTDGIKIPVPAFIKLLSENGVPVPKAMAATGKIYKEFNTRAALAKLTDVKLAALGLEDKEDRKLVLAALRKAGYASDHRKPASAGPSDVTGSCGVSPERQTTQTSASTSNAQAGPSIYPSPNAFRAVTTPPKKKRKRDSLKDFLPDGPVDEATEYGDLDFNEVLDEEVLKTKSTVVNRAPLMSAWATVVAERMGFQREEALSIASVYTEMNAISKGVSLGIYKEDKKKNRDAPLGGTQPYVDIMGRRSLYQTQNSQWRALADDAPAQPSTAFSYISRALRQTTPHIVGALRLLAASYPPGELNAKGFALYADFRPEVDGWGKRGEVNCERILAGRKKDDRVSAQLEAGSSIDVVKHEVAGAKPVEDVNGPDRKRHKGPTLEEFEDEEPTFDDFDLSNLP
ncbi:hypothetical protein PLICRDRAFT_48075 [Plicaturopsis crispa FD-325 SS-3]|nr:hypothetical protein PLICRDRAFT_48075 [Plicaturopsis crispa FD-325 SS-3]